MSFPKQKKVRMAIENWNAKNRCQNERKKGER